MKEMRARLAARAAEVSTSSEHVTALREGTHLELHGHRRIGEEDPLCEDLRWILRYDTSAELLPIVRGVLAELEAQHRDAEASFLAALSTGDDRARGAAIRRLAKLPGSAAQRREAPARDLRHIAEDAAAQLAAIASDRAATHREAALQAMGKLTWRARAHRDALERLSDDPDLGATARSALSAIFPEEPDGIPALIAALGSGGQAGRSAASRLLALGPAVLPALADALRSDDRNLRRAAAKLAARLPAVEIADGMAPLIPAVLEAMADSDRRVQSCARELIVEAGSSIARAAVRALPGANEEARTQLAGCLMPGPEGDAAIPELRDLLRHRKTTPEVSVTAFRILTTLSPESTAEALVLARADLEELLGSLAGRAVYFATPGLVELAGHEDPTRAIAALDALGRLDETPETVDGAIESASRRSDPKVRGAAAAACTGLGRAGLDRTLRAVDDPDPEVSRAAARAILDVTHRSIQADDAPYLRRLVEHPDPELRAAACRLLTTLGPTALAPITDPLERAAVVALGQGLCEIEAHHVPDLLLALRHPDHHVREGALDRLEMANDGGERAKSALLALLTDVEPASRTGAARALGRISGANDVEVTGALEALLNDSDASVACAAAWALERRSAGSRVAVDTLVQLCRHESVAVRRRATSTLGELRKASRHAVPALIEGLSDPDLYVHQNALSGFLVHGPVGESAVPKLIELLGSGDESTRELTALALSSIGPAAAEAATALRRVIRDDDVEEVVDAARRALRDVQAGKPARRKRPR